MRKEWLRHFHFTKVERRSIETVVFGILTLFALPFLGEFFLPNPKSDFSVLEKQLAQIQESSLDGQVLAEAINLFDFDPNTADYDTFTALGLSDVLSNRILNYRNKGGKFFKNEDFAKIYGLSPQEYERLQPYLAIQGQNEHKYNFDKKYAKQAIKIAEKPFLFDPNAASFEEFVALGLPERTAHSILNYREKGGNFFKKSDFKKIYTLADTDYERLLPFVDLPKDQGNKTKADVLLASNNPFQKPWEKEQAKSTTIRIDINTATEEDWQNLQGIGPGYAKRIVKFRKQMGGFLTLNQIAETYGLPDSVFQKIAPQLDLSPIQNKINLNTIAANELYQHPYFSKKQARLIEKYRTQHGDYTSLRDLEKIKILDKPWLEKIKPYVVFE